MEPKMANRRLSVMRPLLAAMLLVGLTACNGSSQNPQSEQPNVDLQGQWQLRSAEIQGHELETPEGSRLTLVISARGNQAHAGCTVVGLAPDVSGDSVVLTATSKGSMRSCPSGTQQGPWDERFLRAVAGVERGERSDQLLTLTGPDVTLTFDEAG